MPAIDIAQVLIAFLVLVFSLTVHEAAHAWSAYQLGDATARSMGRVSLNPAVHVDPIGTIVFPLVAMFTGLPLIGWAKPVPVNMLNLRGNWREKYMLIAAAGPASNLMIALVAAVLLRILVASTDEAGTGALVLLRIVDLNVLLAVFNMIPVPPLDGGTVLAGVLPEQFAKVIDRLRPYGFVILYGLMLSGVLWTIVGPVERWVMGWLLP